MQQTNKNVDQMHINKELSQQSPIIEETKDNEIPPFIMTIDIDQGKSEKIKIFFDSNPEELAFDFCKRNNLDYNAMQYLSEEIKNVIVNNIDPIQNKNHIQEMIKEENEEDEIPTEGNVVKNKNINNEEGIKNEEYFKEGYSIDFKKDEINIKKEEYILQEQDEFNKNLTNKLDLSKDYFQTNPEFNNQNITSQENCLDKKRLNTENFKYISQQNFYDRNIQFHPLNQTKTRSHKNIFDKLYKDAENRRKFVRRNSEKIYRVKHDDSISNLNTVLNNHKPSNILTTQRSREKLNKNCNGVCTNSDGFYSEFKAIPNENCTFRPKINQIPIYSKQQERRTLNKEKPSLLRNYSEYISTCIRDKEEELKEIKERYLTEEPCSFSPKITNKSQEIISGKNTKNSSEYQKLFKNTTTDKHNQLYEEYKQKQQKKQQITENFYSEFNFMPETNKNYQINMDFLERQEIYKRKIEEKHKETEKSKAFPVDKISGQKLFKPKILSKVSSPRKNDDNLGSYLYNFTNVFTNNKKMLSLNIQNELKKNSNLVHTKEKSEQIFQLKKMKTFKRIFSILDSDEDKEISIFSMALNRIPFKIKSIIQPIINKLKEENCVISESEFLEFCEQIFENSNVENRYSLLNFEKVRSGSNSLEKIKAYKTVLLDKNRKKM